MIEMGKEKVEEWKPLPECRHGNEYLLVGGSIFVRKKGQVFVSLTDPDVEQIKKLLGGE